MNLLQKIYGHHITLAPMRAKGQASGRKSPDLAWIFVSPSYKETDSCRTFKTLVNKAQENYYITPNSFYHSKIRRKDTVRWINAIVLDFDEFCLTDAAEAISWAGLPTPSFYNRSPHGIHAWWVLDKPLRAGSSGKVVYLVNLIQRLMVGDTGADPCAMGVERYVRVPHPNTIILPGTGFHRVPFQDLISWKEINHPDDVREESNIHIFRKGIMEQKVFKNLLEGVADGQRSCACLTLALAMKYEKYTENDAYNLLLEWNKKNDPPLRISEISKAVRYAYRCKSKGPKISRVKEIFGDSFSYKVWKLTPKRDRSERSRVHISEWQEDIVLFLNRIGTWKGSITDFAKQLHAPKRSIEEALKRLKKSNRIIMTVEGKGRGSRTSISLIKEVKNKIPVITMPTGTDNQLYFYETTPHTNKYTYDEVVGGSPWLLNNLLHYRNGP